MKIEKLLEYSSKVEMDNHDYWKSRRDDLKELLEEAGFSIEGDTIVDNVTDRLVCPRCKTIVYFFPETHLVCEECKMKFKVDQQRKFVIFP